MSDELAQLKKRVAELEAELADADDQNLQLEREVARRGVKLSCANIALSRAKIAFDEQARHREEAIQDIAHDLRTPLTSIKGATNNVLDGIAGPLDDGVRSYLNIIDDQASRLLEVVNWLLQAIRITSEPRALNAEPTDFGDLVSLACESLRPIAQERGIDLTLEAPHVQACCDAQKLRLVLDNLIGNALKFTDPGGAVRVTLEASDAEVKISVADTGLGMDEAALERIFHRYYRAHPDREGSGLGLLVARELVRLHAGDIEVQSKLGEGSLFTVTLPRSQDDNPMASLGKSKPAD